MASQDWFEKDFYAILGVSADADSAAIKKAYRKLARTLHPDQAPGDAAAEKRFKEIGEAYAVLSSPEDRVEVLLKPVLASQRRLPSYFFAKPRDRAVPYPPNLGTVQSHTCQT